MNSLLTLYTNESKKIYKKRRYRAYTISVSLLVIACGILYAVTGFDYRMAVYPYEVLLVVKYILAPIAVIAMAADLAPRKIDKVLAVLIIAIIIYLFKMFMIVYMASSILSVLICGIASISLASVSAHYAVSFVYEAAAAAVVVLAAALIKEKILNGGDCNEEEK